MKMTVGIKINLDTAKANAAITKAGQKAMADIVRDIHSDALQHSPVKTANNRRSLAFEVSGYGGGEGVVDDSKVQGAVYSTSGYGGYLEIGTGIYGPSGKMITPKNKKMLAWKDDDGKWIFARAVRGIAPRPYIKPAVDSNFTSEKFTAKIKTHLL
jgi:hypothetical protein